MDRGNIYKHIDTCIIAVAVAVTCAGCGAPAVSSDGAIIQVMQQTRENLRAEPGSRQPDVLFFNNAAALLNGTGEELRAKLLGADPLEAPTSLSSRYNDARSLALDAKLAHTRGDEEEAARLLTQSLTRYPTAAALALLLPSLASDASQAASLCSQTLTVAPNDADRLAIIRDCRAVIPDSPLWISLADAAWFDAQRSGAPPEPAPTLNQPPPPPPSP